MSADLLESFAYQLKMARPATLEEIRGRIDELMLRVQALEKEKAAANQDEMNAAIAQRNEHVFVGRNPKPFQVVIEVPPDFIGAMVRVAEGMNMGPTEYIRYQINRLFHQGRVC
jgi:hypothetical protein